MTETTEQFCRRLVRVRLPDGSFTDTVGGIGSGSEGERRALTARELYFLSYLEEKGVIYKPVRPMWKEEEGKIPKLIHDIKDRKG